MKKILIIDDEEDVLLVLGKRLTGAGYQVVKAKNGKEGIEMAKKENPSLILLDILLPDIDGGEVGRLLKLSDKTANIPIIYLTCLYTKKDEKMQGHEMGANLFVAKPYNPDELLSIIKKQLEIA